MRSQIKHEEQYTERTKFVDKREVLESIECRQRIRFEGEEEDERLGARQRMRARAQGIR